MATISIADNDARIQHSIGSGGNTANSTTFTIDFPFFALDDINVIITNSSGVDTTLTRGSGANTFAVSGTAVDDGFSGGNVTLGSVYTSSTVTIFRDIPVTRTTDFATSGPFNIASLNTELDRIIAIEQELETDISRTLKLPDSDGSVSTTLPNIDTRKGKTLAFNASSGAVEAGPTITGVTTVAAMAADIAALADIEDGTIATDAISGLAAIKTDVTAVANIATAVSAVNSNSTNINAVNSNSSNINTVAGSISNVNAVGAKASLITSDFVSDLNTLAVTDVINDINTLATSDIVSDLNMLANSDIVSDLNTLATSDIVSDINTLATSDIVTDLNLLATSDFVSDLNTVATSGNITAVNNVGTNIASVINASNSISSINNFGDTYFVSASAPSSPTLGDLWFDTANNIMKVYGSGGFVNAGSSVNGTANRYAWTVGTASGTYTGSTTVFPATYDAGYADVFLNGVKLLVGTNVTATNGTDVTLATAAAANDIVEIVAYGTFTAATALSLGDNEKIQLGASQDLQIYHDGSDSYVDDTGTGALILRGNANVTIGKYTGETMGFFEADGAVSLYHNNAIKLATTATGVDVSSTDATVNFVSSRGTGATHTITTGGANSGNFNINAASGGDIYVNAENKIFRNAAGSNEHMRIDSSGNVGIGITTPDSEPRLHVRKGDAGGVDSATNSVLTIENSTTAILQFLTPNTANQQIRFGDPQDTGAGFIQYNHTDNAIQFGTNGPEKMRIDSSGNLLVGKTAGSNTTKGSTLTQTGEIVSTITTAGGASQNIFLNRQDAYGTCILMRYANSSVGHIGLFTGNLVYLGAGNTGLKFGADIISPSRADNGNDRDNVIDLGKSASRFDNIYATNATIQTSDANEKQQIAALTDAEMTAAKAISQLFKTFKWNSAVTEKGDAARTHTGVIAQDVEAAMTAAGLDAGDYAFFISSTWWETQTEVPAVEAVEAVYEDVVIAAVLDEDGNEVEAERTEQRTVTEAVEAVDAYTRTDTYDTAEEAPEGATERTRMGIRYPELLAFVGAATEQRLANIETRLTALENV
ncbi:tail fiber domain-containing protein [Alphaproteobacteria bacterium]|nr:tail fiber domain-containing protein [Alphaproteobacteria bacterium]